MKRKIYSRMLEWKNRWNGKTALLIDGARRVGKSWITKEFAQKEYKTHILIDFFNIPIEVKELFEKELHNLDSFFLKLSAIYNTPLYPRESVIIFDEVQMFPRARGAIKYLVEDGRFDFIETGSLVSINHNVRDILIPSEEIRMDLFPMDLEEFLWAIGETLTADYAKKQFQEKKPMGAALHRKMMGLLRLYLLIGGMPQAVLAYREQKDFFEVDQVKRSILNLYRNDISKYAERQAPSVSLLFDHIPGLLQQHEKKFKPSKVKPGSRSREFTEAMFWLDESRVANFAYNVTEPSVGLALNKDVSKLKIYFSDTGLLLSLAFGKEELAQSEIYKKILVGKLDFNKGMLGENLVAQMLRANNHPLYFYSKSSRDDAEERMEIDFLIRKPTVTSRHNIIPIEVKSSNRYHLTSLEKFRSKFSQYLGEPIVLHINDVEEKDGILFLPLYMGMFL